MHYLKWVFIMIFKSMKYILFSLNCRHKWMPHFTFWPNLDIYPSRTNLGTHLKPSMPTPPPVIISEWFLFAALFKMTQTKIMNKLLLRALTVCDMIFIQTIQVHVLYKI